MGELSASYLEEFFGFPLKEYREGKVRFFAPLIKRVVSASDVVFYNPRMEFQRDVSTCLLHAYHMMFGKETDLCEPLASCGVRVVRWICEVPGVRRVVAGDINPKAVFLSNINANLNGVLDRVEFSRTDAGSLLDACLSRGHRFDVVDIDPFGSPVLFIDPAIRALKKEGGLLCLTATDMQPLCGIHQDACLRKYEGVPLRTEYCHEIAVRLLIGVAARIASRNDLGIKVAFSHSSDHYVRTYLLVKKGSIEADKNLTEIGYIFHCFSCGNRKTIRSSSLPTTYLCEICGSKMKVGGPLWCGRLWDEEFVRTARVVAGETEYRLGKRLVRMLVLILSELGGPPTYYDLHSISDSEGLSSPSTLKIVQLLRDNGFFASPTHFKGTCVRTTASITTIKSLMKKRA